MEAVESRARKLEQLAVQQQLRAAYGIKIKNRPVKGKPSRSAPAGNRGGRVFGIPLHELPHQVVPEYGSIPCFLVDACKYLEEHIHTEGLFRKSGSFVRLRTLKSKLDQGEDCLSTAQPCDVAGLLKQFFRELPEPILPSDLQEALIKAQQLDSEKKKSATLLLSCLVNDKTTDALRYFFKFLKKVSLRSVENKMDSSNLAVIFAPNLLQSSETDKMSAHTERKLRLQAAVLQTLIDHAEDIGHIPKFILEKLPAMLGIDDPVAFPLLQEYEENEVVTPGEHTRNRRRSIGVFPSVTPVIITPNFKRKHPTDSCQGFSNKKRRSIRHNMGLELLPSSIFNINSTPGSAQSETSPSVLLDASQSSLSASVSSEKQLHNIGNRRSKRIASKKVQRVESGKMGCFSPKISRKEMVRRSLRLKFILGRNNKENTAVENQASNRSENIGRRLASQQDTESGVDSRRTVALLSPCVGSKNISKSEENLKIPNHNEASYRMSWTGSSITESKQTSSIGTNLMAHLAAEASSSEPVLTFREPPIIPAKSTPVDGQDEQVNNKLRASFCEDQNYLTADTLLKIQKAFSESGSNLQNLFETKHSKSNLIQGTTSFLEVNLERTSLKSQKVTNEELGTLSSTDQNNAVDGSYFQNTDNTTHDLSKSDGYIQEDHLAAMTSSGIQLDSTDTLQEEVLESNEQFTAEEITEEKNGSYEI
ncbi:Rho GTPase-activating protein 11A [Varanus komodoensis]|nr:Rho GTPase-activating protein 11A [Varanus komodoensis]